MVRQLADTTGSSRRRDTGVLLNSVASGTREVERDPPAARLDPERKADVDPSACIRQRKTPPV